MGPQPGSDALLAKENLRARGRFSVIYVGATRRPPPPLPRFLRADRRHENDRFAMKTEFSYVRDIGEVIHERCRPPVLIVSGGGRCGP